MKNINIDKFLIKNIDIDIKNIKTELDNRFNLTDKEIKTRTKLIAEEFQKPFFCGWISCLNIYCYIQDSYSVEEFKNILERCNKHI